MIGSGNGASGLRDPDSSTSPIGHGTRSAGTLLVALLVLGGCLVVLNWLGQRSYAVVETYGGLGGGWAQLLVLIAVGAGAVIGVCLVGVTRLLDRATRARWLVLTGVAVALLTAATGAYLGLLAYTSASELAKHACDDPVGRALVSFAGGLEPGPLVSQDSGLTRGRGDGTCLVWVNVAPDTDIDAEIARVAAANGWSRIQDGWLSPDGVSMTYDATEEPDTMTLVELHGRRGDVP